MGIKIGYCVAGAITYFAYQKSKHWTRWFDRLFNLIWENPVEVAKREQAERIKEMHAIPSMNEDASREILAAEMGASKEEIEQYLDLDTLSSLADIAGAGKDGFTSAMMKSIKKALKK